MIFKKIPSWAIVLFLLIIIVVVALWLRVALPYNQVFVGSWVKMTGVDAYYYMRLLDNLMKHFPHLTQFDPYLLYPGGMSTGASPDFFAYFMGGIIWLLSLGRADQHMVDIIAVYIPPALAVLTVLVVFFIGRSLGSKWLGLLVAGLLAIIPGEFLNRSLLGYTDQHIAEVFFSTGMMMFIFMSIKQGEGKRLGEMAGGGWRVIGKPVIYGLLSGLFLGLYLLTWAGALLFVMILFIFIVGQAVIEHMRGRPLDYLGILAICLFGVGLAMYLPWARNTMTVLSLAIGLLAPVLLVAISGWISGRGIRPWVYPVSLVGLALVGVLAMAIVSPAMLQNMLGSVTVIFVWPMGTTVMEMQPLLMQQGEFTFAVATGNYMLAFFISLICLLVLFYQVIKGWRSDKVLLLIWSVIILLAALSMRRFAYYFAVNVALLTGYLCWIPISALLKKKEIAAAANVSKKTTAKSRRRAAQGTANPQIKRNTVFVALLLAIVALLVYYPNIGPLPDGQKPAIDLATRPLFAPSNAWCEAADWLRTSTPEPFGSADAYYGLYKPVNEKGGFEYPAGAYGVLAWWDYGYWIARIGHRGPTANPGTGNVKEAAYFVAQDEPAAAQVIRDLGIRYVIADNEIAGYDGKFHALATWTNSSYSHYYDVFLQEQNKQYVPTILFYPEYYRTMVARLYNFDGKGVLPDSVNVIEYKEITLQDSRRFKEITGTKTFSSYAEAQAFIRDNAGKNYIIAGQDPYQSPVPLEELKDYRLVYSSGEKTSAGSKSQPVIKIFEYRKNVIP